MSVQRTIKAIAAVFLLGPLFVETAGAQFGYGLPGQLPQNDFRWTWGRYTDGEGIDDFSMVGSDGGFRCSLTGRLRFGSRLSRMDVRALEEDIRQNFSFIRASSNAMYMLEARSELDWASLECERPQAEVDQDQAKRDAREARALERAARERERRRARRAREEERDNSP